MNLLLLTSLAPLAPLTRTVLHGLVTSRLSREFRLWRWKREWRHRQGGYEASLRVSDPLAAAPVPPARRYHPIEPASAASRSRATTPHR
jgi:hypothetical protein